MDALEMQKFLEEAAKYFESRHTNGEDRAHWSNVYNAENCRKIASCLDGFQPALDALAEAVACYGRPGGPWNVPRDPGGWLSRARAALNGFNTKGSASMKTRRVSFQEVRIKTQEKVKCTLCGKMKTKVITACNTVSPFNRNKDGTVRTIKEIRANVIEEHRIEVLKAKEAGTECRNRNNTECNLHIAEFEAKKAAKAAGKVGV